MSLGIARQNDMQTGHDNCAPVPWISNLSPNVFINGKAAALKDTKSQNHGCRNHSSHPAVIMKVSSTVFANNRGIAIKNSECSDKDKVNQTSNDVFANW